MRERKLKLDLDELVVESLAIPATPPRKGTVRGHAYVVSNRDDTVYRTTDPSGWDDTVWRPTELNSCEGSCDSCDCWV